VCFLNKDNGVLISDIVYIDLDSIG